MFRPVPTTRALWLAVLALGPTLFALLVPALMPWIFGADGLLLVLVLVDGFRAPRAASLVLRRVHEPVLSAGRKSAVQLEISLAPGSDAAVRGEMRDWVTPGPGVSGHRASFVAAPVATVTWHLEPSTRGALTFGPVTLRLRGPWGLCSRQVTVPLETKARVFPDLAVLTHDALTLAHAELEAAKRTRRTRGEGRELESLREYQPGDDRRWVDWKSSARRGKLLVRQYQPERNQQVLLFVDCGRHMVGALENRTKLDFAIDAALRLAKVALDQGDQVGVVAFGAEVKRWLPPQRGPSQLREIARVLSDVTASLEESDYGAAIDRAFERGAKRSLVVMLTDLFDVDAAAALLVRTRRLTPRHLPMVVSLRDPQLAELAKGTPVDAEQAYQRVGAQRFEHDGEATASRLREVGARVVRATPQVFAGAPVEAYLDIKRRGLL